MWEEEVVRFVHGSDKSCYRSFSESRHASGVRAGVPLNHLVHLAFRAGGADGAFQDGGSAVNLACPRDTGVRTGYHVSQFPSIFSSNSPDFVGCKAAQVEAYSRAAIECIGRYIILCFAVARNDGTGRVNAEEAADVRVRGAISDDKGRTASVSRNFDYQLGAFAEDDRIACTKRVDNIFVRDFDGRGAAAIARKSGQGDI